MAPKFKDIFVLGRPYGEGRLVEDPETAFMQQAKGCEGSYYDGVGFSHQPPGTNLQVCWCFYCLCIGRWELAGGGGGGGGGKIRSSLLC